MNELRIFEDCDCTKVVAGVLFEGRNYYMQFPTEDPALVAAEIANAGLTDFIVWHKLNRIATLQIVNRIGLVRFFGKLFDVRSEKFLEGMDGKRQFETLLDDLTKISRHIVFDYYSATNAYRSHRKDAHTPSVLERFNFYHQWFSDRPKSRGIETLVKRILRDPHSRLVSEHIDDFIWNVKRPTRQTMQSLFRHHQKFCELPANHPLAGTHSPGLYSPATLRTYFPLRASKVRSTVSVDTPENRFVKHVLLDIEHVCISVKAILKLPTPVLDACDRLLSKVRGLLNHEFLREIGKLDVFPASSPTLASRHGYRELYMIFLRSRLGARQVFEDFEQESLFIDLKDVAQLYEYWVFYRVVRSLLGSEVLVRSRDTVVKEGKLVNGIEVSNGNISVAFNKSFNRKPGESYSLTLRPDISVLINHENRCDILVLDAKYKSVDRTNVDKADDIPLPTRVVKTADLHKMHCYIDAIDGVRSAMAVYPGTEFIFFPRERGLPVAHRAEDAGTAEGVGAVPLIPGEERSENEFEQLMSEIKKWAGRDTT